MATVLDFEDDESTAEDLEMNDTKPVQGERADCVQLAQENGGLPKEDHKKRHGLVENPGKLTISCIRSPGASSAHSSPCNPQRKNFQTLTP